MLNIIVVGVGFYIYIQQYTHKVIGIYDIYCREY